LKILHLNYYDFTGGAAIAGYRLHEALLNNNIDSKIISSNNKNKITTILTLPKLNIIKNIHIKYYKKVINILLLKKYKKTKTKDYGPFSLQLISNKTLIKKVNYLKPDIVHLHWICNNFLSIEDIAKISAPIVWSLHDQWAYTGGCHYTFGENDLCNKYEKCCQYCEFLGSKSQKDLSYKIFKTKQKTYKKIENLAVIGVSNWITNTAKTSALFSSKRVICLPNPINTKLYKPIDKINARLLWNLPTDKKLILFGAVSATSIPYKGYDLLINTLRQLSTNDIEAVVFGSNEPENPPLLQHKIHYLGNLRDDVSLVSLYNACDLMVVPSKRESFCQTASEALSCGTPVVAFGIGGLLDIIEHKLNGYLAKPFDTTDLANGIDWILNNDNYNELSKNARDKVIREFDYDVVAKKYIALYKEILNNQNAALL